MPFGWVTAATAAAGLLSADASQQASGAQTSAANRATDTQRAMFDTVNAQAAPYRQSGYNALSAIAAGTGMRDPMGNDDPAVALFNRDLVNSRGYALQPQEMSQPEVQSQIAAIRASRDPGSPTFDPNNAAFGSSAAQTSPSGITSGQFTHQFGAGDLNANLAPNWKFALEQGQGAAANALNLTGGMGGNFAKGLVDYTLNKSGDLYQNAFSNYNTNQTNIFNRLSAIAGLGQTSNAQGVQGAVGLAPGISQSIQGAGAAQAAGTVGQANAIGGGLTNAASWYALPQVMNYGRTSGGMSAGAGPG